MANIPEDVELTGLVEFTADNNHDVLIRLKDIAAVITGEFPYVLTASGRTFVPKNNDQALIVRNAVRSYHTPFYVFDKLSAPADQDGGQ